MFRCEQIFLTSYSNVFKSIPMKFSSSRSDGLVGLNVVRVGRFSRCQEPFVVILTEQFPRILCRRSSKLRNLSGLFVWSQQKIGHMKVDLITIR